MNTIQSLLVSAAIAAAALGPAAVLAQPAMDHSKMGDMKMDMSKDLTDGEVRKVDQAGGKLTIKHGPIQNLDMPGMTMAFAVKDKALLDRVKAGDKIKFRLELEAGKTVLTEIQAVK